MSRLASILSVALIVIVIGGCASGGGTPIDLLPMYGGMDRQAVPELRAADQKFIEDVTQEFGSRSNASTAFFQQGINFYSNNNYANAMRRFNQAWLLSPENPDVFWGFAMVYHDHGNNCEAHKMIERALALNLANTTALADAGRITTLCAVSKSSLDAATKSEYFATADALYERAINISKNSKAEFSVSEQGYVYSSWATALYWRGDYAGAWDRVAKARALGATLPGQFINMLGEKMPEPS